MTREYPKPPSNAFYAPDYSLCQRYHMVLTSCLDNEQNILRLGVQYRVELSLRSRVLIVRKDYQDGLVRAKNPLIYPDTWNTPPDCFPATSCIPSYPTSIRWGSMSQHQLSRHVPCWTLDMFETNRFRHGIYEFRVEQRGFCYAGPRFLWWTDKKSVIRGLQSGGICSVVMQTGRLGGL